MRLCPFEDDLVADLHPLTLTRPAFDLRCGARTLLERQADHFRASAEGAIVHARRENLCRLAHPALAVNEATAVAEPDTILVNGRWLPPATLADDLSSPVVGLVGDEIAFVVCPGGVPLLDSQAALMEWLTEAREALPSVPAGGMLVRFPWDLVEWNAEALHADADLWCRQRKCRTGADAGAGISVLGRADRVLIDPTAEVQPQVVLDARKGPILIDRGAVLESFTRLEGPCWVGPGTQVFGARVYGGSFGPQCRVGGEVECSILQGFSNKRHDGYLGNSYLGEWVNLGAGTQTGNLRNDFETIRVKIGGVLRETGKLKVGSFVGDHTRTGIGTFLNTGSSIGPYCHLLPNGGLLPREFPAFTEHVNGQVRERTDLRQILATATAVMARRGHAWSENHTEAFFDLYEATAWHRRECLRAAEQRRLRQLV